jgi:hypothetical protein
MPAAVVIVLADKPRSCCICLANSSIRSAPAARFAAGNCKRPMNRSQSVATCTNLWRRPGEMLRPHRRQCRTQRSAAEATFCGVTALVPLTFSRCATTRTSPARFTTESLVAPDAAKCATKRPPSSAAGPSRCHPRTREYRYRVSNMIESPCELRGSDTTPPVKFMWCSAAGLPRGMLPGATYEPTPHWA